MRQLHAQPSSRLVRQLTDAGFIQENIDWMQDYLDPAGKDDTGLLEQARRQDPMTLLPEQRRHCSNLLKGLITQENVDLRKRTAKAFYAVFSTDLSGEAIMQACPWNNLPAQLISLGSALSPTAALTLYANAWQGAPNLREYLLKARPEEIEKALELCGGPQDPARTVLACLWLNQKGPAAKGLLKALLGGQDGHRWAVEAVQEGVIALLPRMAPNLLSGDLQQLSGYIRRGEAAPLPKLTGKVSNLYTSLPGAFGGMCFLAMEAAPELQAAFLVCASAQPAQALRYAVELAKPMRFRAKVPWLVQHTDFFAVLNYLCTSSYRKLAVNLAKDYPAEFERILKQMRPLKRSAPVAVVYQEAQPERFRAIYEQARPNTQAMIVNELSTASSDPAKISHFLCTGEGLDTLVPGHILASGLANRCSYNCLSNYAQEYGLDDFMVRCLIVTAASSVPSLVAYGWDHAEKSKEQEGMDYLLERMHGMGLSAVNCLAVASLIYSNYTYQSEKQKRIEKEAMSWLLAQPEGTVEECLTGEVFTRSTAARALNARRDFDGLLELAKDSSKQVRLLVADLFAAHPTKEGPEAALKLLEGKKASQRDTGLVIINKLDQQAHLHGLFSQKYRPELEAALAKEKSASIASWLKRLLGVKDEEGEAVVVKTITGDPVALALKGGKKRKVQWVLDAVPVPREEDRFAAVMVSCMNNDLPAARSLAKPLDQKELTAYAHGVFNLWLDQKAPSKQKWVLTFASLFGGREMVDALKRQITQWPQEARGAIACDGVMALALSPEPEALLTVDSMSRKFKFKQVKAAAGRALDYAAKELGLTPEELADRIVPDLGLDQRGHRTFDYGPRQFDVSLSPALELEVRTAEGKKLKTMPAPGKQDDPELAAESSAQFKALKKQIKATITTQTLRLEQALSTGRTWTGAGWQDLFVKKPVMRQFAVGLIWGVYEDGEGPHTAAFRYLEDGSLNTADEEEYELSETARVGLLHPVELSPEELSAWKEQLEDYEIKQPFPQLERPVYRPDPAQSEATSLELFGGVVLNGLSLSGKLLGQGWFRGSVQDAGVYYDFYREDGPVGVELNFSGMWVGGEDEEVEVQDVQFYRAGSVKRGSYVYDEPKGDRLLRLREVSPRLYSEIVYQIKKATASSTETRPDWKARK